MNELSEQYTNSDRTAHEQEPTDLKCGISVKGLTKIYKVIASNQGFMVWRGEILANLANHL